MRGAAGRQDELAAHRADGRIRERRHERAQRSGIERLPRVGHDDDLPAQLRHDVVQHGGLSAARLEGDDRHAIGLPGARTLRRPVGRSVGGDHDLQPVARVVERAEILDARADPRGLVVRDDHRAHRRLAAAPVGPGRQSRARRDERVRQQRQ